MSRDKDAIRSVIIREFRSEDQTDAKKIILNGLGEHFGGIDPALNPDLDDIVSTYLERGHPFIVAILNEQIIGTGGLFLEAEDVGRIVRMSVTRDCRGLGIGRMLTQHLVGLAKGLDVHRINVETNHDWYPAIELYKSCGFVQLFVDEESVHMALFLD
jgi:GNAT superfamily N-acetyltransferase